MTREKKYERRLYQYVGGRERAIITAKRCGLAVRTLLVTALPVLAHLWQKKWAAV